MENYLLGRMAGDEKGQNLTSRRVDFRLCTRGDKRCVGDVSMSAEKRFPQRQWYASANYFALANKLRRSQLRTRQNLLSITSEKYTRASG